MEPWLALDREGREEARAMLRRCCGSTRWVERMLGRRPFATREDLLRAAREEWLALSAADWLEAFSDHPRIGDRDDLRRRFPSTAHLSEREQAGVEGASEAVLDALAASNAAYEARFGYIFIVCAAGLTAREMLSTLQSRLMNDPSTELQVAAGEQWKIMERRLLGL